MRFFFRKFLKFRTRTKHPTTMEMMMTMMTRMMMMMMTRLMTRTRRTKRMKRRTTNQRMRKIPIILIIQKSRIAWKSLEPKRNH